MYLGEIFSDQLIFDCLYLPEKSGAEISAIYEGDLMPSGKVGSRCRVPIVESAKFLHALRGTLGYFFVII